MFDSGAMFSRTHVLPDGVRVRLRLPQPRDAAGVRALAQGSLSELEVSRLLHADPRRRLVICATALIERRESIVGIGAIDLDADRLEPSLLLCAPEMCEELEDLLRQAVAGRARTLGKLRAA